MRLADYIFKTLADRYEVNVVFMISGGGAMHLIDAVGRESRIRHLCNHHEQACAMAAEGYARITNRLAVVVVTSGPGGTNTLTGLIGAWLDSVPILFISGQIKMETSILSCPELGLRQLGDQEINIVDIVRPVTKYAAVVTDPLKIREELEKAVHLAVSGRPGPVWLDIPLDVQGALIQEENLIGWESNNVFKQTQDNESTKAAWSILKHAERPLIVAGHGIRLAQAKEEFLKLIHTLRLPVATTFNGFDLVASNDPLFVGRIGTLGNRSGNFSLQNADAVLFLATRNNIRQVSYDWSCYAGNATKIVVDIDPAELSKKTVRSDLSICMDAGKFVSELRTIIEADEMPDWTSWLQWCRDRLIRYPVVLPEYRRSDEGIHPYHFAEVFTSLLPEDATLVAANGTACVSLFHAGVVKLHQRIFWNSGCASMGYGLPASIGAALGASGQDVFCFTGDGSIMMNLQELQTISYHHLPIKIFVLNNHGYRSIQMTQQSFFNGHLVACDSQHGVGFPDFTQVAAAFGLPTYRLVSHKGLAQNIQDLLQIPEPLLCDVVLHRDYIFSPKLSSWKLDDGRMVSRPLEDMFPFLDRKEFMDNMINYQVAESL